jgi:hypothetical protein
MCCVVPAAITASSHFNSAEVFYFLRVILLAKQLTRE